MSAIAGLVPQVSTIVTNAVSLHTVLPAGSRLKILYALPFLRAMTDYLNPQWARKRAGPACEDDCTYGVAGAPQSVIIRCAKQVSFTMAAVFPRFGASENLNEETHEWLSDEFAAVPMSFFTQMAQCVRKETWFRWAVTNTNRPGRETAAGPAARLFASFFAGKNNRCFLPTSPGAKVMVEFTSHPARLPFPLRALPSCGHLDVFMAGKNAGA